MIQYFKLSWINSSNFSKTLLLMVSFMSQFSLAGLQNMQFLSPDHVILNQKAVAVTLEDLRSTETQQLIESLLQFGSGKQETQKMMLVGLAAPQVGFLKRIILVDIGADGKGKKTELRVYINPVLLSKSTETEEWYEGCFSTGNITGIVSRPHQITIRALDPLGHETTEMHSGYAARIFQHEMDHLDGLRFPEKITDDDKLHWVLEDEFPQYRNQERWRNWDKKCSRKQWDLIKSGKLNDALQ